jgi:hypothetical protein
MSILPKYHLLLYVSSHAEALTNCKSNCWLHFITRKLDVVNLWPENTLYLIESPLLILYRISDKFTLHMLLQTSRKILTAEESM